MTYLEIIGMGLPFFAVIGVVLWLGFRGWPARKRYLHARSVALRENARRVHEQQEKLREQQRQQYPQGGPPPGPETRRR